MAIKTSGKLIDTNSAPPPLSSHGSSLAPSSRAGEERGGFHVWNSPNGGAVLRCGGEMSEEEDDAMKK